MKLLFDENISHRIIEKIADIFPDSVHVNFIGLEKALDQQIWDYARKNNLIIVSTVG